MFVPWRQVYHISRNLWSRLETRTVKNVCAPAAVIEDKIYIIGGGFRFSTNKPLSLWHMYSFILVMWGLAALQQMLVFTDF